MPEHHTKAKYEHGEVLEVIFPALHAFSYLHILKRAGAVPSSGRDLVCWAGQQSKAWGWQKANMAGLGYTYSVYVDDNFHYTDEEERYKLCDFATLDEAVAACKRMVDGFLKVEVPPDITPEERYKVYTHFGPDPFIVTNDPGVGHPPFSAWSYAKERCQEG